MVYRVYAEKKPGISPESAGLLSGLRDFLGVKALEAVRILNRYDVDHIDREVFERAKSVVFSEPQVDVVYDETFPMPEGEWTVLAVEALPGQFDQRADSASASSLWRAWSGRWCPMPRCICSGAGCLPRI